MISSADSLDIERAADLICDADGLMIMAGAGMGVDSGLPDFRGTEGFWKAYPALARASLDFASIANPQAFLTDPYQAWGFYGHRLALYRNTKPHLGFEILRNIGERMPNGAFIITSNVDGQFQKAGFSENQILEIHGSIHRIQCFTPCRSTVWSAEHIYPQIDDTLCRWIGDELPKCAKCRGIARPNILMFDDWHWIDQRETVQRVAREIWAEKTGSGIVIELGAGIEIPSIRRGSERSGSPVIRINPRYPELPEGMGVGLRMGAVDALLAIQSILKRRGWLDTK